MKNLKKVLVAIMLVAVVAVSAVLLAGCANVKPVVKDLVNEDGDFYGEFFGYFVQKGDTELISKLNAFIASDDFETKFKQSKAYHDGEEGAKAITLPDLSDNKGVTYTVVTEATYPPYESVGTGADSYGGLKGCDIDMMVLFAESQDAKLKVENKKFDVLIEEVKNNKNYIGAAAMTITAERAESVDFSDPYENSKQVVISAEDIGLTKMADLKGKKIAAQKGTTADILISEEIKSGELKDSGAELITFDSTTDAFTAFKKGKVDAFVLDDLVAKQILKQNA